MGKDINVKLSANTADFQSKMAKARKSFAKFGSKLKQTGKSMTRNISAPLAAIGGGAVMAAANFEKSMNKVKAISGATGKDFDRLKNQAKDLGKTTQFSASQAADAMGFLGMAGFDTEQIMAAMPATLDLAAAGGLELAQAADIASNVLSGFGAEASEMGRFSDVMAAGFTNSNTSLEQLGTAMAYVAPVASGMGLSLEETTAAIGKLSDAGIQGSAAGTSLRGILAQLSQKSDALGVSVFDSAGKMLPLENILEQMKTKGHSASKIMEVFGNKAGPGMLALLKVGGKGLNELTQKLETSGGTAKNIADTQMEGLAGTMTRLKSQLEGVAIQFGEMLLPAMEKVAAVVSNVLTWFSKLDGSTKTIIITVGILAALAGPLVALGGAFATVWAAATGPVGLVIGAIALVGAAIIYLIDNFEALKERFTDIGWWRNAIISMLQFLINLNPFSPLIKGINAVAEYFGKDPIPDPFAMMTESLESLKVETKDYKHQFGSFGDTAAKVGKKVKDALMGLGGSMGVSGGGGSSDSGGGGGSLTKKGPQKINTGGGGSPKLIRVDYEIPEAPLMTFEEKLFNVMDGMSGKVQAFAEKFGTAFQAGFDVIGQALENQSVKLDAYYEKEQQKINASQMSEEEKEAALLKLDEKVAAKRRALARKQAIADKAMAVFNAVINTAAQVTKVIANPIMAGIVAGLGAMQVGLIMGQPLPALAMGGPLAGGQPALVGEQGPEIFKPNTSGTIIPNHALGGAMNISGQFVVSGSDLVATINNELINENGPNAKTIN